MHEIILHHYDMSPYAEKVRLALGLKGLAWRSVQIPIVMPKPDLIELTGGYRRTPVMQLGADIYCDTKACMRLLQRLQPEPSLFPGGDEATVWGLSRWAETSFMMAVTVFLGAGGVFNEKFIEDRKKMAPQVDFSKAGMVVPAKLLQLRANLDQLERQLADGRAFLLGDAPSLADLSAYHPHRFLTAHPATQTLLDPLKHVPAWMDRVAAIGHGERSELEAKDAIAIARDASPAPIEGEAAPLPDGLAYGDAVVVLPEETGSGVVAGQLVPSPVHEIAIRRRSERAGELVIHFPREDYMTVRTG
ncbi:MAG: glutathione S-transferase family protein [Deltaproteobacteria bacterium]|nr:glutathione S-transferase family protein [Deltaproteobacteria bacterium]